MIITITNGPKTKSITIRKFFNFSSENRINDSGILKVSFSTDIEGIESFMIKKGYLIEANLQQDPFSVSCIFSGYISEININNNIISVFACDLIGYCKYRILKQDKDYTNTPIKTIVQDVYTTLNTTATLPFSLGKNTCEEKISINLQKNTSLYFILKELTKKVENLEFRQIHTTLDIDTQTGKLLPGIRQDNAQIRQRKSEVIGWSWKDIFGNFCNYRYDDRGNIVENKENIKDTLLFERYETNPETTPDVLKIHDKGLPKIILDLSKIDIANISVGNRKAIRLLSHVNWISFDYVGIIQKTKFTSTNAGSHIFSVEIGDKIAEQKNILDQTLENIGKTITELKGK